MDHRAPFSTAVTMEGKRQKITNRPMKASPSKVTQESQLVQQQSYQNYWDEKRRAYEEQEQKMLTRIHGSGDVKAQLQKEDYEQLQAHEQTRQQILQEQKLIDKQIEFQMIEKIKYEEMLAVEKKQAEEEYKQFIAYQAEQEQRMKDQNKNLDKQIQQMNDKEIAAQFFGKHFAKSVR